ncbi:hypothetical protein B566_EDAN006501 [Ephemera danica]|nr:hypothetical protein B566_EDAN006501 [Ephemera danica]
MFKCVELPWLVQFFLMFYTDKPVDWLLEHLIYTKICSLDKDAKHCEEAKTQLWINYKPSLFQHIGTHSSLRGKVQMLKLVLFYPHTNPPATSVTSGVTAYKQHTLARAYSGEDFFWGLAPQPGDTLTFSYHPAISLSKYLFRSGNAEQPSDKFYNTTVEVLPSVDVSATSDTELLLTSEGYVIVGHFDSMGVAEGFINPKLWPIKALRLHVHTNSENWAILNEVNVH